MASDGPIRTRRPAFSRWLAASNNITQQFLAIGVDPDFISMAGGLPAAEFYPTEAIAEATQLALARWGAGALEYGPIEGFAPLRQMIAARISRETGRRFAVDNVLLTVGAMQGLDLLGKVLIDPGERIVAQFPTYVGALDAWRPRLPVYEPLDWSPDTGTGVAALAAAKFVYTVPNYSNPTGALVPAAARRRCSKRCWRPGPGWSRTIPICRSNMTARPGRACLPSTAPSSRPAPIAAR